MSLRVFQGFPSETLRFLAQLARNNNRDWFAAHKADYEEHVLDPSLAFIGAMRTPLAKVSPLLEAVPKKTGGSLMRIHRDTRFSKDKTPYKTNVGIHFRHATGCDVHAPGCYVHIQPGECFLGVGTWHPSPPSLAKIRRRIADEPAAWKRARDNKPFRESFELAGESLQRPPQGFDRDHPLIDDLKRKDFIALVRLDDKAIGSRSFVQDTAAAFKAATPLMRFLCGALGVPF
jgi:uncharacterized protein (TIGR02453 family)